MNLNDTIERLFAENVVEIVIGKSPAGAIFVQAKHLITTGPAGNRVNVVHQAENAALVNCIEQIKRQVAHCNELQTRIVEVRRNAN